MIPLLLRLRLFISEPELAEELIRQLAQQAKENGNIELAARCAAAAGDALAASEYLSKRSKDPPALFAASKLAAAAGEDGRSRLLEAQAKERLLAMCEGATGDVQEENPAKVNGDGGLGDVEEENPAQVNVAGHVQEESPVQIKGAGDGEAVQEENPAQVSKFGGSGDVKEENPAQMKDVNLDGDA